MTENRLLFTVVCIGLLLLSICCLADQPGPTMGPTVTAAVTAAPVPVMTGPLPTDTPIPATDTPVPPTSTLLPTNTPTSAPPRPTAALVTGVRVVYHGGIEQDGVGLYEKGVLPWMDLLAQIGGAWYGPEREPDDDVSAQPLLEGYRWECDGGFSCHPNGEAWWNGSAEEGTARLIGPAGTVLAEAGLKVAFHRGGNDPGPPVFSTGGPGG